MTEPASPASESSKAVPVGEPPTPEGWPRTIEVCPVCGEVGVATPPDEPFFCAGTFAEQHERTQSKLVRVAPVGGAGDHPAKSFVSREEHVGALERERLHREEVQAVRDRYRTALETICAIGETRDVEVARKALGASVGEGDEDG